MSYLLNRKTICKSSGEWRNARIQSVQSHDGFDCEKKAPFTRERNRSVPSSFQFLERKNRLFTRERNDCVSLFASVHTGTQSFRSTVFSLVLASFSSNNYIHACVKGKNLIVPFFWTSLAPHCLFTRHSGPDYDFFGHKSYKA